MAEDQHSSLDGYFRSDVSAWAANRPRSMWAKSNKDQDTIRNSLDSDA